MSKIAGGLYHNKAAFLLSMALFALVIAGLDYLFAPMGRRVSFDIFLILWVLLLSMAEILTRGSKDRALLIWSSWLISFIGFAAYLTIEVAIPNIRSLDLVGVVLLIGSSMLWSITGVGWAFVWIFLRRS